MVVVVDVMLCAGASVRLRGTGDSGGILRETARPTKASARGQRTSTCGARAVACVQITGRLLRRTSASRHAMDRFHGSSHGFSIGLGPVKAAWQPLEKLFDLLALDEFVLAFFRSWIGRIGMVCGHGSLIADIVGEFLR